MRPVNPRRLLAWTFVAAVAVNIFPLFRPLLLGDDLEILTRSWTWERTQAALWEPQNEHAMPLGRLSTRALILFARRPSLLPLVTGLQGIAAQLTAMALLYLFVRRERNDPWLGVWASASRRKVRVLHRNGDPTSDGPWIQVGREALPLIDAGMIHSNVDFEREMSPWPLISIVLIVTCLVAFGFWTPTPYWSSIRPR